MAAPSGGVTITHNGLRDRIAFDKGFPLVCIAPEAFGRNVVHLACSKFLQMHALEQYCAKYGLDVCVCFG
jgi:phosphoserine phosphatase